MAGTSYVDNIGVVTQHLKATSVSGSLAFLVKPLEARLKELLP